MEILDYPCSKELLTNLFGAFGWRSFGMIEGYIGKLHSSLGNPAIDRGSLPVLWHDHKELTKTLYEATLKFEGGDTNINQVILPLFSNFLDGFGTKEVYAVGDWKGIGIVTKRARRMRPSEMATARKEAFTEIYFFPKDCSWVFASTHENFSFLSGSKEMMSLMRTVLNN